MGWELVWRTEVWNPPCGICAIHVKLLAMPVPENLLWKFPLLLQKPLTKWNGFCGFNKEIKEDCVHGTISRRLEPTILKE